MSKVKIEQIIKVEPKTTTDGREGFITTAIAGGDQVTGWGKYKVGEIVSTFFDERFNKAKMLKLNPDLFYKK